VPRRFPKKVFELCFARLADAVFPATVRIMDLDSEARAMLQAVRAHIDSLPESERLNGLLKFVAVMLDYLSREQILSIRAEMIESFGELQLAEALNLLDGHLALRELQGE
jgi:hypothetical protein